MRKSVRFTELPTARRPVVSDDQIVVWQSGRTRAANVADVSAGIAAGISKASLGLGNVDNTADVDKPLSTAALAALAGKAPLPPGGAFGALAVKDKVALTDLATETTARLYPTIISRAANLLSDGFGAVGDGVANDAPALQAAINAVEARGGGEVIIPPLEFGIGSTVMYRNTVTLAGMGSPPSGIGGPPVFRGSSLKCIASLPAMFSQADLTVPLHSIGMRRCNVDAGQARGFSVGCAIDLSFINSRFTQNFFRQGTGIGFRNRWNAIASWINWWAENNLEFFNQGLIWEGTDSYIFDNYISSCLSQNIIIDSTGSNQLTGNMIDGCGRNNQSVTTNTNAIAMILRNTKARNATEQQTRNVIVGNNFGENQAGDIVIEAFAGSLMVSTHILCGNKHHNLPGNAILIGSGNRGGIIANCSFSDLSAGSGAVVFAGDATRSPGWSLGPNVFTSGNAAAGYLKYVNAPSGTQILGYT